MLIDVCVPTKNKSLLDQVRRSVEREIPYSRIILEHAVPLSLARYLLIKKAATKWFLFLDDDMILGRDWFKKVSKYMGRNIGAIEGIDLGKKEYEEIKRFERGLLVAALIRKSAVQDWVPREGFESNFEDYDLTQHVIRKGYRWLRVNVPGTHSIDIHPHASRTGFQVFFSKAFTNKERFLYSIHLAKNLISNPDRITGKTLLNYGHSFLLWLQKIKAFKSEKERFCEDIST